MNDETLRDAFQNWETLSATPDEVFAYEARLKRILDEEAFARETELRMQEAELNAKLSVARNLLKKGYDIDLVAEMTELSKEEVEKIKYK